MEKIFIYICFFSLAIVAKIQGVTAIDSDEFPLSVTASQNEASAGSTITVECHVMHPSDGYFYIGWIRQIYSKIHNIGGNSYMDGRYNDRYSVDISSEILPNGIGKYNFVLTIQNAQPEDSGAIGCEMGNSIVMTRIKIT